MSRTILIVDDEPLALRVLQRALEGAGYAVTSARNGAEAWELLQGSRPDLLITDIDMPRLSGEELCNLIRTEMTDRRFPIFVLTSKTSIDHRDWSNAMNDLVFLEKPVSVRRLLVRIGERLEGRTADHAHG